MRFGDDPYYDAGGRNVLARAINRYRFMRDFVDKEVPAENQGSRLLWITICPPDDTPFDTLRDAVERFTRQSYISRYYYVFEQRAEVEDDTNSVPTAYGFHSHLLVEFTNTYYSVSRAVKETYFKKWNTVFVQCPDEYIVDKLRYMRGDKRDDKLSKTRMDHLWRLAEGIEDHYEKNAWDVSDPEMGDDHHEGEQ